MKQAALTEERVDLNVLAAYERGMVRISGLHSPDLIVLSLAVTPCEADLYELPEFAGRRALEGR